MNVTLLRMREDGAYQRIYDKAAIIPLWATDTIFVSRNNIQWLPTANATWPVFKNIIKKGQ